MNKATLILSCLLTTTLIAEQSPESAAEEAQLKDLRKRLNEIYNEIDAKEVQEQNLWLGDWEKAGEEVNSLKANQEEEEKLRAQIQALEKQRQQNDQTPTP